MRVLAAGDTPRRNNHALSIGHPRTLNLEPWAQRLFVHEFVEMGLAEVFVHHASVGCGDVAVTIDELRSRASLCTLTL